jgi:hypothetical protein
MEIRIFFPTSASVRILSDRFLILLELSDNNFLAKDTVQLETEISLRQAVTQCSDASICDGQGFTKSNYVDQPSCGQP